MNDMVSIRKMRCCELPSSQAGKGEATRLGTDETDEPGEAGSALLATAVAADGNFVSADFFRETNHLV